MSTSRLVAIAFVLVFAIVNVVATPLPEPVNIRLGHALAQRDPTPFEPIPAYVKRDGLYLENGKRDTNTIPEETPTQAPNGQIELYGRAPQGGVIPAEVAVKSPNGVVQLY
ncbi:hypothetical protein H4582DRAFT_2053197 [Lactarius indigo]|nr:hypothetical protein H4582DRAFT_2091685 [Lactarius indigo]KAI9445026.1 hypothetical protein H4582DRAFT_2053197 [Lactarius indigo]